MCPASQRDVHWHNLCGTWVCRFCSVTPQIHQCWMGYTDLKRDQVTAGETTEGALVYEVLGIRSTQVKSPHVGQEVPQILFSCGCESRTP